MEYKTTIIKQSINEKTEIDKRRLAQKLLYCVFVFAHDRRSLYHCYFFFERSTQQSPRECSCTKCIFKSIRWFRIVQKKKFLSYETMKQENKWKKCKIFLAHKKVYTRCTWTTLISFIFFLLLFSSLQTVFVHAVVWVMKNAFHLFALIHSNNTMIELVDQC